MSQRTLIAIAFVASVAGSIATSYPPAWHLEETVAGTALTLTPETPKAPYLMTITGNRATFSETGPYDGRWRVKTVLRGSGNTESVVTVTDKPIVDSAGKTATIRGEVDATMIYERNLDVTVSCIQDSCERVVPINFFLVNGGAVSGTFDVTVEIDGPDVPKDEAPKGATLKVKVERAP